MCDYSLHHVKSRPAEVGDKLTTRNFNTGTRGFAAPEDSTTAVCILPGTELAFSEEVQCALWLHLVENENGKLQDSDLSASQQRHAASASRRPRISGWHLCPPDGLTRGSGSNSASTSGTAKNASRGSNPEARHLRGLTLADYPEKDREPPTLLAALPPAGLRRAKGSRMTKCCVRLFAQRYNVSTARVTRCSGAALPGSRLRAVPAFGHSGF
jgi:hypothetical protein